MSPTPISASRPALWLIGGLCILLCFTPLAAQDDGAQDDSPRVVGEVNPDRPFVPAVAAGDFLYLSGAIGLDPASGQVPEQLSAETKELFDYLQGLLQQEDLDFDRVVDAEIFLSDARFRDPLVETWQKRVLSMPGVLPPATAAVEAAIALPTSRVELAMTAARAGVAVTRIEPEGWPASGRLYSWGVQAADTLFVAGMVANDPATGQWLGGDITAQTKQAMQNIETVLRTAEFGWSDVARCRVFLADARDYVAMNAAYGGYFAGGAAPPARSTVQARLMVPDGRVEVQCVAVKDPDRKVVLAAGTSPPDRPFSPSIHAGARLFLAGMVGRGADGYADGVEAQTRVALDRAKAVLEAAGLGWRDAVSVRVFLSDVRYYDAMNRVYKEVLGSPPPARATVGTPLASPEALVEIEVTAYAP